MLFIYVIVSNVATETSMASFAQLIKQGHAWVKHLQTFLFLPGNRTPTGRWPS